MSNYILLEKVSCELQDSKKKLIQILKNLVFIYAVSVLYYFVTNYEERSIITMLWSSGVLIFLLSVIYFLLILGFFGKILRFVIGVNFENDSLVLHYYSVSVNNFFIPKEATRVLNKSDSKLIICHYSKGEYRIKVNRRNYVLNVACFQNHKDLEAELNNLIEVSRSPTSPNK